MHDQVQARRSRPPTVWGYASQLYATAGWTSLPWLHRIAAPNSSSAAGRTPSSRRQTRAFSAPASRNATVHIIPDAGHLLLMDHAVPAAELITCFLRSDTSNT
jgi:hypothetical protein